MASMLQERRVLPHSPIEAGAKRRRKTSLPARSIAENTADRRTPSLVGPIRSGHRCGFVASPDDSPNLRGSDRVALEGVSNAEQNRACAQHRRLMSRRASVARPK